jgi:very-short-patch-repair endonuclease/Cdc6-like AAA superfamily ATPase
VLDEQGSLVTPQASLVLDLLVYIEQVEKLKTKPAFTVPTDFFVANQHDLKGLPELQFNVQDAGGDIWLRVPRLHEIAPPVPDDTLGPWLTLPKAPTKLPELKREVEIHDSKQSLHVERIEEHPEVTELFRRYVENQWQPWAAAEQPRRQAIKRYNEMFAIQQTIATEGSETQIELVWGLGYAAWKKEGSGPALKHPLLTQSCEITLNEKNFELEVRPREIEPRIELDTYTAMELPGVRQLELFWKSALENGANRPNPFEASTFEGVLKAAVGHLDPTGAYVVLTDDPTPPTPGDKLKITNTWVLFARRRSSGIFLEDIARLKKSIEAAKVLPAVVRELVERGPNEIAEPVLPTYRGLSSSEGHSAASELYFPMAYNDEQVSIVQKLQYGNGVVVQGPPGTGKTHTIANIISHYLAQGLRVLVTSKGESALNEVIGKLPERIRPLCVGLLSSESDGMKRFEHSIQTIASNVSGMNASRANAEITVLQEKLNQLHAKISNVDRQVSQHAALHMRNYTFQGREATPEEMAKLVLAQADEHQWMDDDLPEGNAAMPFSEADISAIRQARIKVGQDLVYLNTSVPAADDFPGWAVLNELHRDLSRSKSIEADIAFGAVMPLKDSTFETFEAAKSLMTFLDRRETLQKKLALSNHPGLEAIAMQLGNMRADDPLLAALMQTCSDVRDLEGRRKDLLTKAVSVPSDAEANEDFLEAVARQRAGKSAFPLPFGKGEVRRMIAAVKVLGSAPSTAADWDLVQRTLLWRADTKKNIAKWNSIAREFGIKPQAGALDEATRAITQLQEFIQDTHSLAFDYDAKLRGETEKVFPTRSADNLWDKGKAVVSLIRESLHAHVDKGRLSYAMNRVGDVVGKLDGRNGEIVDKLRAFLTEALGREGQEAATLHNSWLALQAELARVNSLQSALYEIERVSALIEAGAAKKWAWRIRTEPAEADNDPVIPSAWREAWNWRCAVMFLEKIDGHHKLRELFTERKMLTTILARAYQDLVAEKTWLGVYNNSPNAIRQALQAYLNSIQAMGAGTGVRAVRHRRSAREAMKLAYKAVPCWVLPEWRISETLPPDLGLFDLVIIDEASQSDIWALPALLRGEKLLVVGDHKQVSPSAIGVPEEKIKELRDRFLTNQPFGSEMTPDKSIYDLARVVFAGSSVMLQEHFRCVPAIIEYSNREFYEGDIKPLRLPKANERLDPPLIDVFVKGGFRQADVNAAEAKAIVDEIQLILADPQLVGRSIGVVTLLGTAQAAHIQKLANERISPVDLITRQIAVGPPPVFQGRERDIMLVSMVLGPNERGAANRADMKQRYNVAMSRARDRMYLFRSVDRSAFGEDTLNGRLIRHFQEPFRVDARTTQLLRDRCESGFEFDVFDELVKRGYRVEPQVRCGAFKIDFVVEGRDGRRLAIECDGDRFHGPGQWSDDMARQRVLERAGWTFWRCFASSWVRRRDEVVGDLLQTLEGLGIEPLGSDTVDNTVWVHYKEVDPYQIDEPSSETYESSS